MFTTRKRNVGQGNVFTGVCLSRRGLGFPACITGHMTGGGLHLEVGQANRVCLQRGWWANPYLRHMGYYGIGSIRGRCASCWNALLYKYANRSVRDPIRLGMEKCTSHLSVIAQFYPSVRVFTSSCCALVVFLCWVVWDFLRFCLSPKF